MQEGRTAKALEAVQTMGKAGRKKEPQCPTRLQPTPPTERQSGQASGRDALHSPCGKENTDRKKIFMETHLEIAIYARKNISGLS